MSLDTSCSSSDFSHGQGFYLRGSRGFLSFVAISSESELLLCIKVLLETLQSDSYDHLC